jgi:hypothetical protein
MELAERMIELLPEQERFWMVEILSWPVKWTALHGIAEITSPIHRMSVPTDATVETLEVRYAGAGYPAEGARGSGFPHRVELPEPPSRALLYQPSDPAANGFASRDAMNTAHARLLKLIDGRTFGTVVDLGCGDGTLLSRIPAKRRIGVESDPVRAAAAKARGIEVGGFDCTDARLVNGLTTYYRPDLVVAQRDRNPPETLKGYRVLSYSYDEGAAPPELIE